MFPSSTYSVSLTLANVLLDLSEDRVQEYRAVVGQIPCPHGCLFGGLYEVAVHVAAAHGLTHGVMNELIETYNLMHFG